MPRKSTIQIKQSETSAYCKGLRGHVFHGTRAKNLGSIEESRGILVNSDCSMKTTYGDSTNSFYRKKGCVSVFDYESPSTEKWEEHMWKCHPLHVGGLDDIAILFLSEQAKANLIRWNEAKTEWYAERVVPHVEAGHKGKIPFDHISEIIVVQIISD